MVIIETEMLTRVYGKGENAVTALDGVNLRVAPGEFVAVMGPSGCGKSTLLHLIGGLDRPTSGRVILDGQDLARLNDAALTELRRRKIGFVFQFFNLIPVLGAGENAALPLILDGAGRGAVPGHRMAAARGPARPPQPPAPPALGRTAAARGHRPGPGNRAGPDPGG